MSAPAGDSGVDLILDNRKLILGFAILMVVSLVLWPSDEKIKGSAAAGLERR